jgi:hypothetical protein
MSLRIEGMPIDALQDALKNPKLHSNEIENSIGRFGYVEPIVLDERTNRIVAGHGRKAALLKLKSSGGVPPIGVVVNEKGEWIIPVIRGWASKNDKEAEAYLIASNRLVELGGWDEKELASMMSGLQNEDLFGTGYDSFSLGELQGIVEGRAMTAGDVDPYEEWKGMPGFENENIGFRKIIVHFDNQEAVDAFSKLLNQEFTEKTLSIWYPKKEKNVFTDKRYAASES